MPDKLNHAVALKALNDIQTEAAYNVNSGDVRVAGDSRRDYLFSVILTQLLSTVDESTFNNVELAKLPTPDELAANSDQNSLGSQIAGVPLSNTPATSQPTNADQLANQEAGVQPVDQTPTQPPQSPAQPPVETPAVDQAPPPTPDQAPPSAPGADTGQSGDQLSGL